MFKPTTPARCYSSRLLQRLFSRQQQQSVHNIVFNSLRQISYSAFSSEMKPISLSDDSAEVSSLYALNNRIYSIKEHSNSGEIVTARNDMVFFTNFARDYMKPLSIIEVSDAEKTQKAMVLSLNDKVSCAIMLTQTPRSDPLQGKQVKLQSSAGLKISLQGKEVSGCIIDYLGNVQSTSATTANHNDFEINFKLLDFTPDAMVGKQKRETSRRQLYTGNIQVDMTRPICEGNFVLETGQLNTGKSRFAAEIIKQACTTNPNTFGVYSTQSFVSAQKLQSELQSHEQSSQNFIIISPPKDEQAGQASRYFNAFTALHIAQKLQQELSRDVVFVYDNAFDHLFTEQFIFGQLDMPSGIKSVLREMFSMAGYFGEKNGSISSIAIMDVNSDSESGKYAKEIKKFIHEAESYADVIIPFNLTEPLLRQVRPKIQFKGKSLVSQHTWQNALFLKVSKRLNAILVKLNAQSTEIALKKEMKLTIEPWDYYLHFDSAIFMRLLVSSTYYSPVEQLIFVRFIVHAIEEETISQFKQSPAELTKSFFEFARNFKEFHKQDIFTYIGGYYARCDSTNEQEELVENLQHCVLRVYELFIMHCKMNDTLHPFKKDYFN